MFSIFYRTLSYAPTYHVQMHVLCDIKSSLYYVLFWRGDEYPAAGPVQATVVSPHSLFPYHREKHLITYVLKQSNLYLSLNHILLKKPTSVSLKTGKAENLSQCSAL